MAYTNTLITIAPDCPVEKAEIPVSNRANKPLHIIQYELLTENPYKIGHEDLIFQTKLIREELEYLTDDEKQEMWDQLFSKGHPCMRASALTKRYGYGAHYDREGKIAIYPMESNEYNKLVVDKKIKKIPAMRSKR